MATEQNECGVCYETFNNTTHISVACEHTGVCGFSACSDCVKTYLNGITTDPNCMECNKAWSDKFLAKKLGPTYMKGEYITHRKELLVQQQLSRLPETMPAVERHKRADLVWEQMRTLTAQHKTAVKEAKALSLKFTELSREFAALQCDTTDKAEFKINKINFSAQKKALEDKYKHNYETKAQLLATKRELSNVWVHLRNGGQSAAAEEKKEEGPKFIMPCPKTDCRGYLSSQYKCSMCEHHTCAKCFELIGLTKEEAGHVCKSENIESADFIRKQTKPCPACCTRISKIDGCDQMWCTQCQKAFSWNTGKIVTGVIHNPHFYQYQREHGGGVAPRNPGDVVCGGLPGVWQVTNKFNQTSLPKQSKFMIDTVMNIHRLQSHFTHVDVHPLRQKLLTEQNYEEERILYILQQIGRDELASKIFRKDKARKINISVLHLCELFIAVGTDLFQNIMLSENKGQAFANELETRVFEYDQLRQYCNEHFKEISILYGVCVPVIKADWTSSSTKYNAKGETDTYIIKRDGLRAEKKKAQDRADEERRKQWQDMNEARRVAAEIVIQRQRLLQAQQLELA